MGTTMTYYSRGKKISSQKVSTGYSDALWETSYWADIEVSNYDLIDNEDRDSIEAILVASPIIRKNLLEGALMACLAVIRKTDDDSSDMPIGGLVLTMSLSNLNIDAIRIG